MPYTNPTQILTDLPVKFLAPIEGMLPEGAPKFSETLVDIANKLPAVPDLPIEIPDIPALPELPEFPGIPTPPGEGEALRLRKKVAATPAVVRRREPTYLY